MGEKLKRNIKFLMKNIFGLRYFILIIMFFAIPTIVTIFYTRWVFYISLFLMIIYVAEKYYFKSYEFKENGLETYYNVTWKDTHIDWKEIFIEIKDSQGVSKILYLIMIMLCILIAIIRCFALIAPLFFSISIVLLLTKSIELHIFYISIINYIFWRYYYVPMENKDWKLLIWLIECLRFFSLVLVIYVKSGAFNWRYADIISTSIVATITLDKVIEYILNKKAKETD